MSETSTYASTKADSPRQNMAIVTIVVDMRNVQNGLCQKLGELRKAKS